VAGYAPAMSLAENSFGHLLREWRKRRRMSQLDLALDSDISTRHLSFMETGRAQPSRDMVLLLADQLAVPLRDRNVLLTAAGYAPVFSERKLDDPALAAARQAVELVIQGHVPYPAIAVDRHWTLVAANDAVPQLLIGVDPELLSPPVNVMRLALHPRGLAPRTVNLAEWRGHLLEQLRRQVVASADPLLIALLEEVQGYAVASEPRRPQRPRDYSCMVVPFELLTERGLLAFFSTITVFGTPIDVTLSELAMECFYPADAATAAILQNAASAARAPSEAAGQSRTIVARPMGSPDP
jgi:transcriptional regulator with XRE-family HTH domain